MLKNQQLVITLIHNMKYLSEDIRGDSSYTSKSIQRYMPWEWSQSIKSFCPAINPRPGILGI
jgi:hypothetical protein